jgi:hypothetical protein
MPPRRWTALFFLDEATALAAGHRPCAECRRDDWHRFRAAWAEGHGLSAPPPTPDIDRTLHVQRLDGKRKRTFTAPASALPPGTLYRDTAGAIFLALEDQALPWSFAGYGQPRPRPTSEVTVLTPPGTLSALRTGYRPLLHSSARSAPSCSADHG